MTRPPWLLVMAPFLLVGCVGERLGVLEDDVVDVQTSTTSVEDTVAALSARLDAVEAATEAHATAIAANTADLAALTLEVDAHAAELATQGDDITANAEDIAAQASAITVLQSDVEAVEVALDDAGSCRVVTGEWEVFSGATTTGWRDLDLTAQVGTGPVVVALRGTNEGSSGFVNVLAFRAEGDLGDYVTNQTPLGSNKVNLSGNGTSGMVVIHAPAGIVEWKASDVHADIALDLMMYITCD